MTDHNAEGGEQIFLKKKKKERNEDTSSVEGAEAEAGATEGITK